VHGSTLVTGTIVWHPEDGLVNKLRIAHAYRAIYIELEHSRARTSPAQPAVANRDVVRVAVGLTLVASSPRSKG